MRWHYQGENVQAEEQQGGKSWRRKDAQPGQGTVNRPEGSEWKDQQREEKRISANM